MENKYLLTYLLTCINPPVLFLVLLHCKNRTIKALNEKWDLKLQMTPPPLMLVT